MEKTSSIAGLLIVGLSHQIGIATIIDKARQEEKKKLKDREEAKEILRTKNYSNI